MHMKKTVQSALLSLFLSIVLMPLSAKAQGIKEMLGIPEDSKWYFPEAASTIAEEIHGFHEMLLYIISAISLLVLVLLVIVVLRYNARANPEPGKFSHNWALEIFWIAVPTLVVLVIAIFSMRLLYFQDLQQEPDMRIEVTGYQWYWGYKYPDHGDIEFMSYMLADDEINEERGDKRLLSTDTKIVVPVDKVVQVLVTAGDVIHSWTVPAFGVKIDAIPGHMNETWFKITEPGIYYGQCSELCGKDHAYMPIEVHAVSQDEFEQWVLDQGGELQETAAAEQVE